jgi:hypothetical protein
MKVDVKTVAMIAVVAVVAVAVAKKVPMVKEYV